MVVATGPGADPRLVDAADLMLGDAWVKHPMNAGRLGQRSIMRWEAMFECPVAS